MRNYNEEIKDTVDRKYGYHFDFNILHPYTVRSFCPFFIKGSILELGSFKGAFTKRLLQHFEKVTCIEASSEAAEIAKNELKDRVEIIISTFEDAKLTQRFDNIVLTHVLEHLDDPIFVLDKIKKEWLSENGKLFITCPNANAVSRQLAVKMGLIDCSTAVTKPERMHGHKITYTVETLSRDVKLGGLEIIHTSGIIFKPFANYQWDQLIDTNIISEGFIEACYELGFKYPDLCASIFVLCR